MNVLNIFHKTSSIFGVYVVIVYKRSASEIFDDEFKSCLDMTFSDLYDAFKTLLFCTAVLIIHT